MKKILEKIVVACLMLVAAFSLITPLTANQAYADAPTYKPCTYTFLGMKSWDCDLKSWDIEDNIKGNIRQIIMNIGEDGVTIVGYVALGFVIWGGYLYMMSSGDPGKAMSAKKTITRAIIGLLIVASAKIIFNAIVIAFVKNTEGAQITSGDGLTEIMNAINWAIGIAGVVCAVFIVVGGFGYMTSAGDPAKLQKAKKTIVYAVIGLIIVALSFTITNFVIKNLANAKGKTSALPESTLLAIKE